MNTITVHPSDINQETAIRMFLDALQADYSASGKGMNDTEYFLSSPVMKERLDKAAEQEKNGEGKSISLDEIWK